jgi:hypothetical protein
VIVTAKRQLSILRWIKTHPRWQWVIVMDPIATSEFSAEEPLDTETRDSGKAPNDSVLRKPISLTESTVEGRIETVVRVLNQAPDRSVLRLFYTEQYGAGVFVERGHLAQTASQAREIVEACAILGFNPLQATVEPEEGFFYVRLSNQNENFVYIQTPKARVIAMFQENLDVSECARALAWVQTDLSEPFESEDGQMYVS